MFQTKQILDELTNRFNIFNPNLIIDRDDGLEEDESHHKRHNKHGSRDRHRRHRRDRYYLDTER